MRKNKKGLSPVIASVLLVALVVGMGTITFQWFRGISGEDVTKFDQNIKLVCGDVDLDVSYTDSTNTLYIKNEDSEIPIADFKIKVVDDDGSFETEDLGESLNPGESKSIDFSEGSGAKELVVIPVLNGVSDDGQTEYICDEKDVIIILYSLWLD